MWLVDFLGHHLEPQKVCSTIVTSFFRLIFKLFCQAVYPAGMITNCFNLHFLKNYTLLCLCDLYENWTVNVLYYALTNLNYIDLSKSEVLRFF